MKSLSFSHILAPSSLANVLLLICLLRCDTHHPPMFIFRTQFILKFFFILHSLRILYLTFLFFNLNSHFHFLSQLFRVFFQSFLVLQRHFIFFFLLFLLNNLS
eukprot:110367_1